MKTGVKITFGFYDVGAKADAALTITQKQPFANQQELAAANELAVAKYATLERNQFLLDGSYQFLPQQPGEGIGVWLDVLSDEKGVLNPAPQLTAEFTEPHSSSGLTFRFYEPTNDYCSKLWVAWYDGAGSLLRQGDYYPDNWNYFCEGKVIDYKKIVVRFYETNLPRRFVKLTGLEYGEKIVWGPERLIQADMRQSIDPVSAKISINTLNLTLFSDDPRFNLYNPQGVYELLQERQEMEVQRYLDGVKQEKNYFYLASWEEAGESPASFEAYDAMGFLDVANFKGDLYTAKPVSELVAEIFAEAGVEYQLADSLAGQTVSGLIPACTCREALRDVAYVTGAVVDCSGGRAVKIYPPAVTVAGTLPLSRQAMSQSIRQALPVTGVEVVAHQYKEKTDQAESTLYQDHVEVGELELPLSQPYYGLSVSGNGSVYIKDHTATYVKIQADAPGNIVVYGKPYEHTQETISHNADSLSAGVKKNVVQPADCTLINKSNAQTVAQRVYDYYQNRYTLTLPMLLHQEQPGQLLVAAGQRPRHFEGRLEEANVDLLAGFLTDATLQGKLQDGEVE